METIQTHYTIKCTELGVEPNVRVLDVFKKINLGNLNIDTDENGNLLNGNEIDQTLDLSGITLPFKGWKAFTHGLKYDSFFTNLVFSDSNIDDDGTLLTFLIEFVEINFDYLYSWDNDLCCFKR